MKFKFASLLCGASLGLVPVVSLAAPIVTNGSFEEGVNISGSFATISSGLTGWSIAGGNIDYIGSYWTASAGVRSLDLNGSELPAPTVSQEVSLVAGQQYRLSFDVAGNPDNGPTVKTLNVSILGALGITPVSFDTTGKSKPNIGWETRNFFFTAPTDGSYTLSFQSTVSAPCCYGPALDNVSISAVPEVETYSMMMAGLGLVGFVARRRSQAKSAV